MGTGDLFTRVLFENRIGVGFDPGESSFFFKKKKIATRWSLTPELGLRTRRSWAVGPTGSR